MMNLRMWRWGQVTSYKMVRGGLLDKAAFEHRLKGENEQTTEDILSRGHAWVNALRWECACSFQGTVKRPVCLEHILYAHV